MKGLE